jgi:hypothetical protein
MVNIHQDIRPVKITMLRALTNLEFSAFEAIDIETIQVMTTIFQRFI